MKRIILIGFVILTTLSCKKNGLGDSCTIEGTVKHHSKTITNATAFLKFKAADFPGKDTTLYDAKVSVDKDGYFKFNTLKGEYFVYVRGFDFGIAPPYIVEGGQSVKLRAKETTSLTLAVTEGD